MSVPHASPTGNQLALLLPQQHAFLRSSIYHYYATLQFFRKSYKALALSISALLVVASIICLHTFVCMDVRVCVLLSDFIN